MRPTFDDTPLFVNLRLQDLDRVEVLRGPQGTLYGSGSLGGTIRFVQNASDPLAIDAKVEAGLSSTAHTHALNEDVNAMLNLPLSETFAFRLNAGYTGEAGFINQPNLYALNSAGAPLAAQPGNLLSPPETYSKDGTNAYLYRSVRAAALWKPNDDFHVQLSYYHQLSTADGYPYAAPFYGVDSLSSSDYIQATTNDRVDLVALTLEYELGFATLTSNSSWAQHDNVSEGDVTSLYDFFPFYPSLYGANPRALVVGHQEYGTMISLGRRRSGSRQKLVDLMTGWAASFTGVSKPIFANTTFTPDISTISMPVCRCMASAAATV